MKHLPLILAIGVAFLSLLLAAGLFVHTRYQQMVDVGVAASVAVLGPLEKTDVDSHAALMAVSAVEISPILREIRKAYDLSELRLYDRRGLQIYPLAATNRIETRLQGIAFKRTERGYAPHYRFLSPRQMAVLYPVASIKDPRATGCVFFVMDLF